MPPRNLGERAIPPSQGGAAIDDRNSRKADDGEIEVTFERSVNSASDVSTAISWGATLLAS
jgi:hypothetical protein